ncbi:hypothetical protein [Lederbergia galactosidilytica]|uniref:DUF2089 domain-containing protein n=1 Tax=Lederbergia galactosidilytica TaxID=217031 RepID=A0A178A165_9BACI|nr:hypothetical protein [Lederbergia galactosidilytica]KRG14928.1 hypothetical protein ACA30_09715 [Virgibacillus soli]OAK73844.1 hypothetical protein ABB05_05245 [Lederbergia galactosidilytica]
MKEEIKKILGMMEEGKLDSEEATALIQALQEKEVVETKVAEPDYLKKFLKIRISDQEDKVNVNLPLRLVKVALQSGLDIAAKLPESAKYVEGIDKVDVDLILEAIENEAEGQIVDITGGDGEQVSIVIE